MQLDLSPAVRNALETGQPVVALETTVITHGLEPPDNLEIATGMESAIREEDCCPATLGIIDGRVVVGLNAGQIEQFASAPRGSISKCSRRDLPVLIGGGKSGSLTVAGTMMVAHAAGIRILATGGIGGVHRGHPFDVSADLMEFARSAVAVVCAGAKSILDLPATLEVLETQGVPVIGLGTENLPAFYARDSGLPLPAHGNDVVEVGGMLRAWADMDDATGLLVTVPVPEEHALPIEDAEAAITQAVEEADAAGIQGSAVTPYILKRVTEISDGRTLTANKALLLNNARTAAQLARQIAR